MLRSTTAMRSSSQCSAYFTRSRSISARLACAPYTSSSAKARPSSSTGWRAQKSRACAAGSSSPPRSSWYRNWSASSRAFLRRVILSGASRPGPPRVACCRRGWLRTPAPHAADELGHLERGLRGLLAAVAYLAARAVPRLLLAEGGDHAEGRRHAGGERDLADPRGPLARDVLEVRRLAA